MGHLVQLLLPVRDNDGQPFSFKVFADTRTELIQQFGGVTAYMQAPARGLWVADDGEVSRDDIVIFEVMMETLDRAWWATYRESLLRRFKQKEMVVRSLGVEML